MTSKINSPYISIVIPVYNSAACLFELHKRLVLNLKKISTKYEIIFIDDASSDASSEIIFELSRIYKNVKCIQFTRNFGQHYAITAGLDYSSGNWVVVMDCDLQDRPEDIIKLYKKAISGYEVVSARRLNRKDTFIKRTLSIIFYKIFSYLADIKYDGNIGNFRILSRRVVNNISKMRERLRFFGGLLDWLSFPSAFIDVQHSERFSGKSTYNFRKLWKLASETIIAYSDKPLRIAIKLGFVISFIAFIVGLYFLAKTMIYGSKISGWASLIISFYLIGGIVILILGIIGLYLGKNYEESKERPLYVVRKSTFDHD